MEQQYRMLEPGELLLKGDEFFDYTTAKWLPRISFSAGAPPLTPGHKPERCSLAKFKEYLGEFWID